jgi:hypothetical protein
MNYDLSTIDQNQFFVVPHLIAGETVYLVTPQRIGVNWTKENSIFRSSVWNSNGELISGGYKKFVNWGEKPENFPTPNTLHGCTVVEKLDGSLLIVSKYQGQYIIRTRGTVDASKLDNGHEIELFKQQHSLVLNHDNSATWDHSILFEWTTPTNRIVIDYGAEPSWKLIGLVYHDDYSLAGQDTLDFVANQLNLERPETFTFRSTEELIASVEQWKGKEGVCVYSKSGQEIHKVKGQQYLFLHRMKESLSSIDKVIDVWFSIGKPDYQKFETYITNQFDYELWQQIRGEASKICDAYKQVVQIIDGMKVFVDKTLVPMPTRRQQAERVKSSYGITNRASFVFALLDGKPLDSEQEKKLLYQCLKS